MLKFVYSFFLGLLLVVFVGMGVATFYPAPKAPGYPAALERPLGVTQEYTAEQKQLDKAYQTSMDAYDRASKTYNRNVSLIALGAAIVLLVVGLLLNAKISVLADGLLLGGVFTLLYSIARSFAGDNPKYSFGVVSVGILITVIVGYLEFMQPLTTAQAVKRKRAGSSKRGRSA